MLAQVIKVDVNALRRKALDRPEIMVRLWEALVPRLIYLFPEKFPIFADMSAKKVKQFFFNKKNVEIAMLAAGQEINLPAGGVLWRGEIEPSAESRQQWKEQQTPGGEKTIGVDDVEENSHSSLIKEEDLR